MILSLKTQTRDGGRFEKIVRGTSTRDCSLGTNETIYKWVLARLVSVSLFRSAEIGLPLPGKAQRSWLGDGSKLTKEPHMALAR